MSAPDRVLSAEMARILNISVKTLHRHRQLEGEDRFLELGKHFFRRSPSSGEFVWDVEKTKKAWTAVTGRDVA
jgi:hypothetical protein